MIDTYSPFPSLSDTAWILINVMMVSTSSHHFTSHQRLARFDGKKQKRASTSRSVHFSSLSQMFVYIERDSRGPKSFSSEDERHFQKNIARDAIRLATKLLDPARVMTQEDIVGCIGIEGLLSGDRTRRSIEDRHNHVQRVLSMQGKCTATELCWISQESSSRSRQIATSRALSYWNKLKV